MDDKNKNTNISFYLKNPTKLAKFLKFFHNLCRKIEYFHNPTDFFIFCSKNVKKHSFKSDYSIKYSRKLWL